MLRRSTLYFLLQAQWGLSESQRPLHLGTASIITAIVAVGALLTPIFLPHPFARELPPLPGRTPHSASVAERQNNGPLPQYFADEFGWENMVQQVARVYNGLSPEDRARTAIFYNSWGEAAAIDFFGRGMAPAAISHHNNYWYLGTARLHR